MKRSAGLPLRPAVDRAAEHRGQPAPFDLIVLASSAGGLDALTRVLARIPAAFPVPIAVAQHLRAGARSCLADLLARVTPLSLRWAQDGAPLLPGRVHIAPPGRHLRILAPGVCTVDETPKVNYSRPAADPLFVSAAATYGPRVIGVVLSGRLRDGSSGTIAIRRAGGVVIAQDPASCASPDMPRAAISTGGVNFVLGTDAIGHALVSLTMVVGVPALFGIAGAEVRAA